MQSKCSTEEALQYLADSNLAKKNKKIKKCDFLFQGCMLLREQHHVFSLAGPIPIKAYFFFGRVLPVSERLLSELVVSSHSPKATWHLYVGCRAECVRGWLLVSMWPCNKLETCSGRSLVFASRQLGWTSAPP